VKTLKRLLWFPVLVLGALLWGISLVWEAAKAAADGKADGGDAPVNGWIPVRDEGLACEKCGLVKQVAWHKTIGGRLVIMCYDHGPKWGWFK
jgi:hypothetical protein